MNLLLRTVSTEENHILFFNQLFSRDVSQIIQAYLLQINHRYKEMGWKGSFLTCCMGKLWLVGDNTFEVRDEDQSYLVPEEDDTKQYVQVRSFGEQVYLLDKGNAMIEIYNGTDFVLIERIKTCSTPLSFTISENEIFVLNESGVFVYTIDNQKFIPFPGFLRIDLCQTKLVLMNQLKIVSLTITLQYEDTLYESSFLPGLSGLCKMDQWIVFSDDSTMVFLNVKTRQVEYEFGQSNKWFYDGYDVGESLVDCVVYNNHIYISTEEASTLMMKCSIDLR
jgi:hypothetical protein